ncbi:hypothetical protein LMG28614_07263 [Paraburkholderia ultramafica]|uniref:Uncharacterized protein n=1 Tax=Paraburkholderia ultramafica TaxID=1544867 RepID=A0A6S7CIZ5_9BURK|nr:hypothetical protein [Paraburkholderia ultramafica]CAB3810374.1 hypothetical protein LMG28614_07263 [Paraburkholderia ultramafica]
MDDDESTGLPEDVIELRAWMNAWFDHAVSVGFICPPFILCEAMAERLEGYFKVGLTPEESADALFGVTH